MHTSLDISNVTPFRCLILGKLVLELVALKYILRLRLHFTTWRTVERVKQHRSLQEVVTRKGIVSTEISCLLNNVKIFFFSVKIGVSLSESILPWNHTIFEEN